MTKQEAYDYLRKARYASERKATEDALRPRMVLSAEQAADREALARGDRAREAMYAWADRITDEAKDITAGAIVPGHDD